MEEGVGMLRFYFVIITAILTDLYFIPLMWYYAKHSAKYSEAECYKIGLDLIHMIIKRGRITTVSAGEENLPNSSGYMMYANHQGKYDALGILSTHKNPCSVIMDKDIAERLIPNLFLNLIKGKRLDKKNPRQQVSLIQEVSSEIMEGRIYLIFPEGTYSNNKNRLQDFHAGSFKLPLMAKCPIIPVAIYDSYKPFSENSLKRVHTQVHYLEPIYYDEYADMKTKDIRDLVYRKIQKKIDEIECIKTNNDFLDLALDKLI